MGAQIKIEWKDVGEVSKVISPKVGVVVGCHPERGSVTASSKIQSKSYGCGQDSQKTSITLQGDTSRCSLGSVDMKTKVVF